MELSLAIDQGNSSAKLTVFSGTTIMAGERFAELDSEALAGLLGKYPIASAIYSSVAGNDNAIIALLREQTQRCFVLDSGLPLPLKIGYATPQTLGNDRIAAAAGAASLFPGKNLLVVDAGTAITYDFVTDDGCFIGGNIAPGMQLRFSALAGFCAKLPLVDGNGDIPLLGYDTPTAIRAGVVSGIRAEITCLAEQLKARHGDLTVVLTGGDSEIIAGQPGLNDMLIENNLVTIGLNRILQYNELL